MALVDDAIVDHNPLGLEKRALCVRGALGTALPLCARWGSGSARRCSSP